MWAWSYIQLWSGLSHIVDWRQDGPKWGLMFQLSTLIGGICGSHVGMDMKLRAKRLLKRSLWHDLFMAGLSGRSTSRLGLFTYMRRFTWFCVHIILIFNLIQHSINDFKNKTCDYRVTRLLSNNTWLITYYICLSNFVIKIRNKPPI